RPALRRFMAYVWPYAGLISFATFCGILKFILPASLAIAQRFVIDKLVPQTQVSHEKTDTTYRWTLSYLQWLAHVLPARWGLNTPWGQLNLLMVTLVIVYAIWAVTFYLRGYLAQLAGHRVILDLRTDLYQHITRMSHSFFQEHQSGGIVSRLMSDIALAQNFVGSAMTAIWMDLATCILFIWLMISWDRPLALASLGVFPFYIASMRTYGRAAKRTTKAVQEAIEEFSGDVQERVAGIQVVKSFATERRETRSFFCGARGLYDLTMHSVRVSALSTTVAQWLTQMATLAILWYGGYRILHGYTTVGTVTAFMILLRELYMPMNRISDMNTVLNNSLAAIDRVFEVFDIEADVQEKPHALRLPRLKGNIKFEQVTFGYDAERPVLREIDLDIKPGEVIALVGASGAGKSTLVQLIPRFYDPQQGRVVIDGVDVRDVNLRSLRSQIGVVAQETLLFSGTARENLLYGKPSASDEELIQATKAAHAYEFLMDLPDGFDTVLGERGAKLSGGQKQRIAIARAFLSDPRILILDEATSALDSESEALIQEALAQLMQNRTNIVIAHRLSTILNSDRIAVMKQGCIVDIGPHKELLVRCRLYANLYNTQFRVALAS
ncbi:MAG: ABC transporter ATP-binding protein, partial [Abitibacteriaceae bacterium]|nr:ABC transporter ATP-binding protein [Abditibacteriaceae bacterium]